VVFEGAGLHPGKTAHLVLGTIEVQKGPACASRAGRSIAIAFASVFEDAVIGLSGKSALFARW
jgi:hypothetical protein